MAISVVEINEILTGWAAISPPIENFTVEHILEKAGLGLEDYDEVFNFLMRMRDYIVIPKKILLCPDNHKCHEFDLEDPIDPEEIYDCWCGEEDFDPEHVIITFNFTDEFREGSLKKKKYLNNRLQPA